MVKVLDSQPLHLGFESCHTLGLLCLKALGKICTLKVSEVIVNMQLLACREPHKIKFKIKIIAYPRVNAALEKTLQQGSRYQSQFVKR